MRTREEAQLHLSWDPKSNCYSTIRDQKPPQALSAPTLPGAEFQT